MYFWKVIKSDSNVEVCVVTHANSKVPTVRRECPPRSIQKFYGKSADRSFHCVPITERGERSSTDGWHLLKTGKILGFRPGSAPFAAGFLGAGAEGACGGLLLYVLYEVYIVIRVNYAHQLLQLKIAGFPEIPQNPRGNPRIGSNSGTRSNSGNPELLELSAQTHY